MKKVTLTFIVPDEVVGEVQNEVTWGNMDTAAHILDENCEYSHFDVEDYQNKETTKILMLALRDVAFDKANSGKYGVYPHDGEEFNKEVEDAFSDDGTTWSANNGEVFSITDKEVKEWARFKYHAEIE